MNSSFSSKPEVDIARNIRTIEWLKSELVSGLGTLFKGMMRNHEDAILESLANTIITCFILGRRIGINFSRIMMKVENKVKANIEAGHEIEKWYGDFSALQRYFEDSKR